MKKTLKINSIPKSGTSRSYRESILEPAEEVQPEERNLEDFLSLTVDMARQIRYVNFQNEPDGTWLDFFAGDPAFVLADILSFDSGRDQAEFEKDIKKLQYSLFIGESGNEKWHGMMHRIFDLLVRADGWLTAFKRTDETLSGFKKELWSIREELQGLIYNLRHLHHRFEKISGQEMDLSLGLLSNFEIKSQTSAGEPETDASDDKLTDDMISELIQIHREFSNSLHHLKGAAERFFRRSFLTKNHEPHIGLYITFLQLYRELSSNFNDYTSHHRSFFYNKVLGQQPRSATPDKAILVFTVSEGFDSVSIPEDTTFPAGQTDAGEEIVFKTTSPIALNRARIKSIRTFLLGNNKLYKPSGDYDDEFVTGIYVAERTNENFSGTKWPLLGEDQTDLVKQNRTMEDSLVGFALSSPAFFLKGGEREIKLRFHISDVSYKKFLKFAADIVRSEKKSDDINESYDVQGLLIRLFKDGFILDYTSGEGWVEKPRFFIDINPDAVLTRDDLHTTADSDGMNSTGPVLEVSFKLRKDEPPVAGYSKDIHGLDFRKSNPVIRLRLNPDAHLFPYSLMCGLKISSTSCDIKVSDLNDLVVYNDIGLVNSSEAFYPFGPVPVRKSWMAVSHPEAFNKNIDTVSLKISWEQLPDKPYGFNDYYSGYPGEIDNQSFKIRLFELDESQWIPLEKKERFLFRTERQRQPNCPEPRGRLFDTTRIENISLVNTSVVDRPGQIYTVPEYTSKTAQGFIKIALTSPEHAFGHKQYPLLMSNTFLQNAKVKKLKHMVSLPNEPYTPIVRRLTMDYRQSFNKTVKENSERGGVDLYHIRSFDESVIINADLQDDTEYLFPQTDHRGHITFEIVGAKPPQVLSLFFLLRDNINDNTFTAMPCVGWEYYVNGEWHPFKTDAIIRDGTKGFMNSGIVVLDIPETVRHDHEYLKTGLIKIRAYANDHAEIVARAIGISTQAAEVERVLTNGLERSTPVPEGTITGVNGSFQGLSTISQRLPSYGGTSPEDGESMIIRVSELLKHRGKAVTSRDYERLILQRFNEVRMVNCLPGVSTKNNKSDSGKVLIAVIPDVRRYPDTSRFRPRFSAGKLYEMKSYLTDKTSAFSDIEVRNPRYERITIRCTVRFREGIESGLNLKKLNFEISNYISPWCYDNDIAIEFGASLDLTSITGFIHSRPYVEMVTGLSAVKISMMSKNLYELSDTARMEADQESGGVVIEPTRAWSVMVSDKQHNIELTNDSDVREPEKAGIENLKLGDSFIIDDWVDESANLTN